MTGHSASTEPHKVVMMRSLPGIIYLLPTCIAALVAAIIVETAPEHVRWTSGIFLAILALNLVVVAFDLSHAKALIALLAIVVLILIALRYNNENAVWNGLRDMVDGFNPEANSWFLGSIGVVLAVMIPSSYLFHCHFYFWDFHGYVIERHSGRGPATQGFPAARVRQIQVQTPDIFEHFFFGSGRLIITLDNQTPIVIDHVPHARRKMFEIQEILAKGGLGAPTS
jgi:hypothetical protein